MFKGQILPIFSALYTWSQRYCQFVSFRQKLKNGQFQYRKGVGVGRFRCCLTSQQPLHLKHTEALSRRQDSPLLKQHKSWWGECCFRYEQYSRGNNELRMHHKDKRPAWWNCQYSKYLSLNWPYNLIFPACATVKHPVFQPLCSFHLPRGKNVWCCCS